LYERAYTEVTIFGQ